MIRIADQLGLNVPIFIPQLCVPSVFPSIFRKPWRMQQQVPLPFGLNTFGFSSLSPDRSVTCIARGRKMGPYHLYLNGPEEERKMTRERQKDDNFSEGDFPLISFPLNVIASFVRMSAVCCVQYVA